MVESLIKDTQNKRHLCINLLCTNLQYMYIVYGGLHFYLERGQLLYNGQNAPVSTVYVCTYPKNMKTLTCQQGPHKLVCINTCTY